MEECVNDTIEPNEITGFSERLMAALSERLVSDGDLRAFAGNITAAYIKPREEALDDDFLFDAIRPAIISLIRFKDDTAKELRLLLKLIGDNNYANEGTDYAVEIIEDVLNNVDDILAGYDVHSYRREDDKFNPRRQSAVKKLTAERPEQVKTVAESLSDGYERRGVVISKERVSAFAAEFAETNNREGM